jgi:hypothetical protein
MSSNLSAENNGALLDLRHEKVVSIGSQIASQGEERELLLKQMFLIEAGQSLLDFDAQQTQLKSAVQLHNAQTNFNGATLDTIVQEKRNLSPLDLLTTSTANGANAAAAAAAATTTTTADAPTNPSLFGSLELFKRLCRFFSQA